VSSAAGSRRGVVLVLCRPRPGAVSLDLREKFFARRDVNCITATFRESDVGARTQKVKRSFRGQ
jgi:hypothetical protein